VKNCSDNIDVNGFRVIFRYLKLVYGFSTCELN